MYISSSLLVASLCLAASTIASPLEARALNTSHYWTTIKSANSFCVFLPPKPGLEVAVNENNGIPFCSTTNLTPKAKKFPTGFITTAHYLKTSTYTQITGFFDRTKYKLKSTDGGGQYDNHAHGKPVGAQCVGYNYFVNLIEPDVNRFCIRCCQEKADCNTGRSGYGCLRVVDGDYTVASSKSHSNNHINSVYDDLTSLGGQSDSAAVTSDTVNDKIASEIQELEAALANGSSTADQVQAAWTTFTTDIAQQNPDVADDINQLKTISSGFTTNEQWEAFFTLLMDKITQAQKDYAATVTTETTSPSHSNYVQNDWLLDHEKQPHDNQATW
ncbi:hypothetical protein K501DRAFT_322987 [Backusella circina FSU 941]|nr:hypothetical protein K501DRAFT_322987 [Backusella circina FSU 941]